MNSDFFANYNLRTKIFGGSIFLISLFAIGFAFFEITAFSAHQFIVLGVAIAVSGFANQHEIRIPKTQIIISAKELVMFWGMIWLGIPGAVFLAVSGSLAKYSLGVKSKFHWLFSIFNNICASFAASYIFYFSLRYFAEFSAKTIGGNEIAWYWLVAGVGLSAAVHFAISHLLNAIFFFLDGNTANEELWKTSLSAKIVQHILSFGTVFLIHFLFLEFGIAFGWVVLTVAAIIHLTHRIYEERLESKVKEIRNASRIHLATVEALATAIDARDQVGIGHVRRTQIYAVGIGEILGLSDTEINALKTGALLHDIGKLAVPDHILNKPGRLTPAEMEKIKIHSTVGASIIENIDFDYPVAETIKYHHESWDGSGYPAGLKGKQIPLTARILAVADAFDTLRGARPYRAAISREEARRFLLNGAGSQFDTQIVDIFLRNLPNFEAQIESEGLSYKTELNVENAVLIQTDDDNAKNYVEQIKRANREVFTLYELARTFSASLSLEEIYALFAKKIRELVPFDTCAVYLMNEITDEAKAVYVEGKNNAALKDIYIKSGEGGTGFALKKRQAVTSVIASLDFSYSQVQFDEDYTAMASLPLIANENLLGAISIYSCSLENYEDEHLRLLETVSRIASDAISKSIYHAETESKALTDPMTSLPNARSLQIHFEKEAARANRTNKKLQILMLDLDGFKAVNDTFGHKVGDKFLKEISKVMRGQLRDYDFLARYAGDEFVAIIPETDNRSIKELCQRIEKAVQNFLLPIGDGRFARVGISIGAASYPNNGEMLDQILISADKAMYAAKSIRKQKRKEARKVQPTEPLNQNQQQPTMPLPAVVKPVEPTIITTEDIIVDPPDENFLVELDESHIISSAIN